MLSLSGKTAKACDGVTRRELLRIGGLSLFPGLSLPNLLQAEANQGTPRQGTAKSVVLINLFGGPSHIDMFDMKPDAPENIRGEFKPIQTSVPGTVICEHLPKTARWMHRSSLIRTVTHTLNSHHPYSVLTGWGQGPERAGVKKEDHPSMGSVCQYLGLGRGDVPGYVFMPAYPGHSQNPRPGAHAGYLGSAYDPLFTRCDPKFARNGEFYDPVLPIGPSRLPGLDTIPDVTAERLIGRRDLLRALELDQQTPVPADELASMARFKNRAFDLLTAGRTREAFDLSREEASVRERYGEDLFGSSLLIARRLVEAGSTFITFHWECAVETHGCHWDMHSKNFEMLKFNLPLLDKMYDNLVQDLHDRGLLDSTLVMVTGEMGRTPKVNAKAGRDHWTRCGFCLMTGGGVKPGVVFGSSDKMGAYPEVDPASPGDVVATVYQLLGVDPTTTVPDLFGRPIHIAHGGQPIRNIIA
jgi:hypothetical protein